MIEFVYDSDNVLYWAIEGCEVIGMARQLSQVTTQEPAMVVDLRDETCGKIYSTSPVTMVGGYYPDVLHEFLQAARLWLRADPKECLMNPPREAFFDDLRRRSSWLRFELRTVAAARKAGVIE